MRSIALINSKGGVGKSTLAINLAHALTEFGAAVLLVDADQGARSSSDWAAVRAQAGREPLFDVRAIFTPTLHEDLPRLAAGHDLAIIDCPPSPGPVLKSAILAADLVLIPTQPSPLDVWAMSTLLDSITAAAAFRAQALKIVFVINRKIANTAIGRDVHAAFSGFPYPVLACTVGQRVAFPEAAGQGATVLETGRGTPAAEEIHTLAYALIHALTPDEGEQTHAEKPH